MVELMPFWSLQLIDHLRNIEELEIIEALSCSHLELFYYETQSMDRVDQLFSRVPSNFDLQKTASKWLPYFANPNTGTPLLYDGIKPSTICLGYRFFNEQISQYRLRSSSKNLMRSFLHKLPQSFAITSHDSVQYPQAFKPND